MAGGLKGRFTSLYLSYDTAIWVRVLGTALTSVTGFMLRPYMVLYLHDKMDGSVLLPMIIVGLPPFFGMIMNLYGGTLSDKYGRKPVMLMSLWIQALCMLGYLFADNAWEYAIAASLMGVGNALFMPAANAQVADVVADHKRATVFALLHTALNIGAAAGPLLGLLMFSWHPQLVFLICALSTLLYSGLVWAKVPETRPVFTADASSAYCETAARRKGTLERRLGWSEHKNVYLITLCALVANMLYAQVETTLPLHLQTHFYNYKSVLATMLTFNGLFVIGLQMWIVRRSEALPSYAVIGAAYALFALVALGYGFAPRLWLLLATEFLFTIGEMLNGPHVQKVVSDIAPRDMRGRYFSIYGMNGQLSRALGPVIGGLLMNAFGGEAMFVMLGAAIAIGGVAQASVIRKATFIHVKVYSVHTQTAKDSVTLKG